MYENIYSREEVLSEIANVVSDVGKTLGLDLTVDSSYLEAWLNSFGYRNEVWKVGRIRYWLRTFIWRIGDLAQSGADIDPIIDEYAEKAHLSDEEKGLIRDIAYMFRDGYIRDLRIAGIMAKLRRGEISRDQAEKELSEFVKYPELIDALIEKNFIDIANEYTLSVSTLLSYATMISIPDEYISKRLDALKIPQEDKSIILQVFRVKPIKDELATIIRRLLDEFEEGYVDEADVRTGLAAYFKKPIEIELLVNASKIAKDISLKKLKVKAIIGKLKRGAITVDTAKADLLKIIKDKERVEALIDAEAKVRTVSTDKLVSMMEYLPIDMKKFEAKMDAEGVPEDEKELYRVYTVATEVAEEIGKLATELVTDYANGKINEQQLTSELDRLATLGGWVPQNLRVEWIVLSPLERSMLVALAKLRRMRTAKS
jgi:hypothetical protein